MMNAHLDEIVLVPNFPICEYIKYTFSNNLQPRKGVSWNNFCLQYVDLLFYYLALTFLDWTQVAFTCSKLTIETLEKCVKYVQS